MQQLKKYSAILFLILLFPFARFVAVNFMLEADNEIYAYIPQDSDLVIEINNRNFIKELAYQRIYNETYFTDLVYRSEGDEMESKYVETGLDLFGKVILFREQWAGESIWLSIMKYNDKDQVKAFALTQMPESHFQFADGYVIFQLNNSSNQEKLDQHLIKICNKEVKGFNERVNLAAVFNPKKEINCYIIPANHDHNQLIDGYISFDFLKDKIAIDGEFVAMAGFNETPATAYTLDKSKAFSLRSSLNLFNSIYWFNKEKIDGVPQYNQVAFDYNGVECFMIHKNMGYSTPFKSYPNLNVQFDIKDRQQWKEFFTSLETDKRIVIDSANQTLITPEGAFFKYNFDNRVFQLSQDGIFDLVANTQEKVYFDLHLNTTALIENTVFKVDPENPPSKLEQQFGMMIANELMDQIQTLANMEAIDFQLVESEDNHVKAIGEIGMKNKEGHAIIESLKFGMSAFLFIKDY